MYSMQKVNLKTDHLDPLKVLSSTKEILKSPKFVYIDFDKVKEIKNLIKKRIEEGFPSANDCFRVNHSLKDDVQLIFLEDVVNFCFWFKKGIPRWQVEYPEGDVANGWFALKKSFDRALAENIPILDANYLADLKLEEVKHIFRSVSVTKIPLIEKRLENLREAGNVLLEKYEGSFLNLLQKVNFSAPEVAKELYNNFPSFRDIFNFKDNKIYFLKRAQICPYDLSYLESEYSEDFKIKDLDQLTIFADYKLPQVLRAFGVISYSESLSNKVDNYVTIPQGSREEMEIRASIIWACELVRQEIPQFTNVLIDNALWFLSIELNKEDLLPYHRTKSIYY